MRELSIIKTEALSRYQSTADDLLENAIEGVFLLAYGQAGRGKTVAAKQYHADRGVSAYVKVHQNMTQTAFLQKILFEVVGKNGEMPRHNASRCKDMIITTLHRNMENREGCRMIKVDEADRLTVDRIEDLRDILDDTNIPIGLIAEEGIFGLLQSRRRIWSRVHPDHIEFGAISGVEVGIYAMQNFELDIPADICHQITKKAEGDFRLVRNMMFLIEKVAKAAETSVVDKKVFDKAIAGHSWRRS